MKYKKNYTGGGEDIFQDNLDFCFSWFNLNLKYTNGVIIFSTSCFLCQMQHTCRACMCAAKGFSELVNISSKSYTHADIYRNLSIFPPNLVPMLTSIGTLSLL